MSKSTRPRRAQFGTHVGRGLSKLGRRIARAQKSYALIYALRDMRRERLEAEAEKSGR